MAWRTRRIVSDGSQMYRKVREVLGLWSYMLDQAGMSVDEAEGQGSNGNEQSRLCVYMMTRLLIEKAQAIPTNGKPIVCYIYYRCCLVLGLHLQAFLPWQTKAISS